MHRIVTVIRRECAIWQMVDHKTAGPITFYRSTVMTADRGLITALQITGTEVAVLSDPGRAGTTFAVFRPNYRSWGSMNSIIPCITSNYLCL